MQKEIRELYEDFRQKEGVSRFAMQTFTNEVLDIISEGNLNQQTQQRLIQLFNELINTVNTVTEYSVNNLLDRTIRILQNHQQEQQQQDIPEVNPNEVISEDEKDSE